MTVPTTRSPCHKEPDLLKSQIMSSKIVCFVGGRLAGDLPSVCAQMKTRGRQWCLNEGVFCVYYCDFFFPPPWRLPTVSMEDCQ